MGRALAVGAACIALAACTGEASSDIPEAASVAREFLMAWSEGSAGAMEQSFDEQAASTWEGADLESWFADTMAQGSVEDFAVQATGDVIEPPESDLEDDDVTPVARVPYEIIYQSTAASDLITLAGQLPLTYDRAAGAWEVPWRIAHMWPGLPEARGFDVELRYGRRGVLLDRTGKVLAKGTGEGRRYPAGTTAGSTVGHLERLSWRDLAEAPEGHQRGDLVGGSGLEQAFEERLAGEPASRLFVTDLAGDRIDEIGTSQGGGGGRVRTTLDLRIQRAAARAFGQTAGGAVVLDPRTGDVLAVVSSSEFNPANYVGVDELEPFNRALSGLYPPGSSLKVATAAAALDSGVMKRTSKLTGPANYRGVRNFESGEFGTIDFGTALKFSVNTAFAQIAEKVGARRLHGYMEAFGFNHETEMPVEAATSSFPFPEDEADLMWGAIGQAAVVATPLEMATVAGTIANDGVRMEPRIDQSVDPSGERVVSRRTAAVMTELMENVVVGGTGQRANLGTPSVAGKTGTAEVDAAGKLNHAWFICFAPSRDPRIAVAVVAELGGVGGEVAAPLARGILQGALPYVR